MSDKNDERIAELEAENKALRVANPDTGTILLLEGQRKKLAATVKEQGERLDKISIEIVNLIGSRNIVSQIEVVTWLAEINKVAREGSDE